MKFKTISIDGDYFLQPTIGNVQNQFSTSVQIMSNLDGAVVTFGSADKSLGFVAYENGAITTDAILDHGLGAIIMVRISGLSSNDVVIAYSE